MVVLGAVDSGKTTFACGVLAAGLRAGLSGAYLDTDLGQSRVGPPTTIGLRHIRRPGDLSDPFVADVGYFVGDVSPRGRLLPLVAGTGLLLRQQAVAGHTLTVVDTSGFVTGRAAEQCKFHKLELARPAYVIGLQRDAELGALLRIARRFTRAHVVALPVHPAVVPTRAGQRAEHRRAGLARYFDTDLSRHPVSGEVFMPSLPSGFDLAALHGMLVGVHDEAGAYRGLGLLEHHEGVLRLAAPRHAAASPRCGLRLGAVRVDDTWRPRSVDLRALFERA